MEEPSHSLKYVGFRRLLSIHIISLTTEIDQPNIDSEYRQLSTQKYFILN